jgi:hypothetical protein
MKICSSLLQFCPEFLIADDDGGEGDHKHRVPKFSIRWLYINFIKRNKYLADKELKQKTIIY